MKIVHITPNYYPSLGGLQELFQQFSERLVSVFGDDVTVLTTNALQSPHARYVQYIPKTTAHINGVVVHRFPFSRHFRSLYRFFAKVTYKLGLPFPFREYAQLLSIGPVSLSMFHSVLQSEVDVIAAASSPYLHMFFPILARHLGNKTPYIYIGALHIENNNQNLSPLILRGIHAANAYMAFTEYEKEYLVVNGVPFHKIHVISPGVNVDEFSGYNIESCRRTYQLKEGPVIGFIGRQAASKGLDTLLYAMLDVWKFCPDAQLLIAGARTEFSSRIDEILSTFDLNQQQKVKVIDVFDAHEKAQIFSAIDIFVTASCSESFGIVFLEAWASQKPVIGVRIGAIQSLIDDGEDGLLVSCRDTSDLAVKILYLLRHEAERLRLGYNGYLKVVERYSWEASTFKLRKLYESVM